MKRYRCEYCGNFFDPNKEGVCPSCGAAVSPAVLTRLEREQASAEKRAERMKEDIVRRHEQQTQSGQTGNPTRLSNAAARSKTGSDKSGTEPPGIKVIFTVIFVVMSVVVLLIIFANATWALRGMKWEFFQELPVELVDDEAEFEPEEYLPEEPALLGQAVVGDGYEVTAVAVRDYEAQWYETQNLPEGMRIVAVEFRVVNRSEEVYTVADLWGWAEDEKGYLDVETHAPNDRERANRLYTGDLYPGSEASGCIFLEVPRDALRLRLFYDDEIEFLIDLPKSEHN